MATHSPKELQVTTNDSNNNNNNTNDSNQTRRRPRGKRGGGRKRRSLPTTATTALEEESSTTTWRALEVDWFLPCPNNDQLMKVPEPMSLSDIMTTSNSDFATEKSGKNELLLLNDVDVHVDVDAVQQLRHLWHNYSRKRQPRQTKGGGGGGGKFHNTTIIWEPRPIQLQAWSVLLPATNNTTSNHDHDELVSRNINLIGLSPTASGKTTSFGAPMVVAARAAAAEAANGPTSKSKNIPTASSVLFGLVLAPTRELAHQIAKEFNVMISCLDTATTTTTTNTSTDRQSNNSHHVRAMACCGGDKQSTQDHVDILLQQRGGGCRWLVSATPGRCSDIIRTLHQQQQQQQQNSSNNNHKDNTTLLNVMYQPAYIILDEADRLAGNSDLAEQVSSILQACLSAESTTLAFFSATYPRKAHDQWKQWMNLSHRPCAMVRVDAVSIETSALSSPKKKIKTEEPTNSDNYLLCTDETPSGSSIANATTTKEMKNEQQLDGVDEDDNNDQMECAETSNQQSNNDNFDSNSNINNNNNNNNSKSDFLSKIPPYLVQTLHVCAEHKKPRKLINTLDKIRKEEKTHKSRQKRLVIVFFGRIKTLQYISKLLQKQQQQSDHACLELHSQLPQHVRTKNLQTFQSGKVPVILATDIAARGVHISNISFVINYDFPGNIEQYVHRCGRAGRNYQQPKEQPGTGTTNSATMMPPTVFSFFTRALAPMAKDLVALLQACKSHVDPNLLALVGNDGEETTGGKQKTKKPKSKNNDKPAAQNNKADKSPIDKNEQASDADDADDDDDSDAFPELSANRIVLKRADHVSDASSSDDDSSSDED